MNKTCLLFAGDFCSKASTRSITVSEELKALIQSCNLSVVNFEVPLKPENTNIPWQRQERFYQHDDAPNFLRSIGFNLFSIATNHTFDWGYEGYKKTKQAFGEAAFGAGTYDEAYQVKIVDINGIKIGFMAVCYAAYTGVFDDCYNHEGLGCAYINDQKVNHVIVDAKKQVDYLFVLPHDGIEYIDIPLPEIIARYRDFIDWGADAVIGTHPHCPQGWESYKGKPIYYSLGNFLFNSKKGYDYRAWNRPHWYEGLCVVITIENGKLDYKTINTQNEGNLAISIDYRKERELHNNNLCAYLQDKEQYDLLLNKELKRLAREHEMPIIDKTFHEYNLKSIYKQLFKYTIKRILRKPLPDDASLHNLLRNDSRRSVLLRAIRR